MGGRTNNAGDWLTGKTQDQFDQQSSRAKASAELLRKSGYKRAIDINTGEEYDFRATAGAKVPGLADAPDEAWKEYGESYITNASKDPFANPKDANLTEKPNVKPVSPDLTDEALRKARTSAFLRAQQGNNRQSSFAMKGALGGFNVEKPVLGGY